VRKARIIAGLVAASLFGGPAADAVALHNGDDNRVKQGFERLLNCQPAPAIADLTGPFIEAMKQGTPDGRARAARYLTLIGHGFGIDGNIPSYLACANMARSLDSENPTIIAFQMQALLRASRRDEVRDLVRQYEKTGERNSYLARTIGDYYRLLGDADTADAWLKKAMALNPSDPNPYAIYGRNSATDPKEQCAYLRQAADRTEPGSYRKEMYLWSADRMLMQGAAKTEHLEKAAALLPNEPGWRMSKAFFVLIKNDVNNSLN
jgi:tetratricopeptide (TPR) repeat protein